MARFSIVIPSFGKISSLEETLASVLRYRPEGAQVIVAHGGNYDDRYGLGKEVEFVQLETVTSNHASGLIDLFNLGVKQSKGRWIGFLRPGIQLREGWEVGIENAFSRPDVASVAPLIVSESNTQQLVTAGICSGAGFSRELITSLSETRQSSSAVLGPCSWAAFYRRSFLLALDDCDATLGAEYFDLDLALSFSVLGFKNISLPNSKLVCSADEMQELMAESRRPHGCAAARAKTRFSPYLDSSPELTRLSAWFKDLLNWPWRWQHSTHLKQRQLAERFKSSDENYRDLLGLLLEQRSRLLSPGLHAHVAAHRRSANSGANVVAGNRKAA